MGNPIIVVFICVENSIILGKPFTLIILAVKCFQHYNCTRQAWLPVNYYFRMRSFIKQLIQILIQTPSREVRTAICKIG